MGSFTILVLVPRDATDVAAAVEYLLEPYYMWHQAPPHKHYIDSETVQSLAAQYGLPATDLGTIAAALREQYRSDDQWSDEEGLYFVTTANPQGKWEHWGFDPESDIWPASAIPSSMVFTGPKSKTVRNIHPTAVVTPDRQWHDLGDAAEPSTGQRMAVPQRAYDLISQHPTHLVVAVDCE
jgi:hypothetical protein